MGSFEKLLTYFVHLRRNESQWINKTDIQAIRSLWLGCGTLLSFFLSATLFAAGASVPLVLVLAPVFLAIVLPIAFLLSSHHIDRRKRRLSLSGDRFNNRTYLEDKFEAEVRRIDLLQIDQQAKKKLILDEYKEFKKATQQIDAAIETFESVSFEKIHGEVGILKLIVERSNQHMLLDADKGISQKRRSPLNTANNALQPLVSELKDTGLVKSKNMRVALGPYSDRPAVSDYITSKLNDETVDLDEMVVFANLIETENLFTPSDRDSFVSEIWLIKAML